MAIIANFALTKKETSAFFLHSKLYRSIIMMSIIRNALMGTTAVFMAISASAAQPIYPADPATGELLLADPTIINHEGKYYMAGTLPDSSTGFAVFESDDLLHWNAASSEIGLQLSPRDDVYGTTWFWAPQFVVDNGKIYMFYTANEHVARAEADKIGSYYRAVVPSTSTVSATKPEPIDGSCGNIDPFLFRDSDGKCYLYHVRFDNGNYLWVGEFDMSTGKIVDGTLRPTFRVDQPWEDTQTYESAPIMEGPTLLKISDTYYLFYSANHFMSKDYAVGYATAPTPYGPWTKNPDNPMISHEIMGESGSGHGDVFTDKEGNLRYVYHVHNSGEKVSPRRTRIVSLKVTPDTKPGAPAKITADPSTIIKPVLSGK